MRFRLKNIAILASLYFYSCSTLANDNLVPSRDGQAHITVRIPEGFKLDSAQLFYSGEGSLCKKPALDFEVTNTAIYPIIYLNNPEYDFKVRGEYDLNRSTVTFPNLELELKKVKLVTLCRFKLEYVTLLLLDERDIYPNVKFHSRDLLAAISIQDSPDRENKQASFSKSCFYQERHADEDTYQIQCGEDASWTDFATAVDINRDYDINIELKINFEEVFRNN